MVAAPGRAHCLNLLASFIRKCSRVYYADASLRPSAFAGWSAEKYAGFFDGATVNFDHIQFIQLIQEYMALGNGIKTSVNIAGGMPQCQWVMSSQFKIYGCWDLTFWAFND